MQHLLHSFFDASFFVSYAISTHSISLIKDAGGKFYLEYSLQQLEAIIPPDRFFRVNRTFIVHIDSIVKIVSYSNTRLKLMLKTILLKN